MDQYQDPQASKKKKGNGPENLLRLKHRAGSGNAAYTTPYSIPSLNKTGEENPLA